MLSKNDQVGRFRKKAKLKRVNMPESELQELCESYLDNLQVKYIHIPQSAYRNRRSSGFLSGIPDLLIFFRHGKYLFVELKTKTGERSSQKKWSRDLIKYYHLINNFNDFKKLIDEKINEA